MTREIESILDAVGAIVLGKQQQLKLTVACILARGHLLIEDLPGALWTRDMFRRDDGTERGRIVVAVDPPATSGAGADGCGIVVAARTDTGAVVLEDLTLKPAAPIAWAK